MDTIFLIGLPGGGEWILILLAILLLFGGKKIPELMRGIGKGIREFNSAKSSIEEEIKEGMKACVKSPSAKIRRKRLGTFNAMKNISDHTEAPSAEAISISRIRPVMRESRIPKLLVNIDRRRMILFMLKLDIFYRNVDLKKKYDNMTYF